MKLQIPELCSFALKLLYICLALIFVYTICLALAADRISPFLASELFQSALAATAISLGGGLLLDCEIRHSKNKN